MRILFVCTGNSCRSPMAEALAKQFLPTYDIFSAGIVPEKNVSPFSVRVMKKYGFDISNHKPRHINEFHREQFSMIVCFSRKAYDYCKFSFINLKVVFADISDPWGSHGTDEQIMSIYEETYNAIKEKIVKYPAQCCFHAKCTKFAVNLPN